MMLVFDACRHEAAGMQTYYYINAIRPALGKHGKPRRSKEERRKRKGKEKQGKDEKRRRTCSESVSSAKPSA